MTAQLGTLQSGEVVFDRPKSHLRTHGDAALERTLPAALSQIVSQGREFIVHTAEFETEVGSTNCVETNEQSDILFARRENRKGLSRFVLARTLEPTRFVTFALKKIPEGYVLVTAYFGPHAPPEPWDARAEADSVTFWRTHALVWEPHMIVAGTETRDSSKYFS